MHPLCPFFPFPFLFFIRDYIFSVSLTPWLCMYFFEGGFSLPGPWGGGGRVGEIDKCVLWEEGLHWGGSLELSSLHIAHVIQIHEGVLWGRRGRRCSAHHSRRLHRNPRVLNHYHVTAVYVPHLSRFMYIMLGVYTAPVPVRPRPVLAPHPLANYYFFFFQTKSAVFNPGELSTGCFFISISGLFSKY